MLKNYIKIAARFMGRHKTHSLLNIQGLAIGMTCFILIFLFVQNELSYDQFHDNGDRIYRVAGSYDQGGDERNYSALTTYIMKKWLDTSFPDIERTVRLMAGSGLMKQGDKFIRENHLLFADEGFFDMFSYPLLTGDPATVLNEPNSAVITQAIAEKYFGDENPVGKNLNFEGDILIGITGVMAEMPANSHLQADIVISMKTAEPTYPAWVLTNATGLSHYTYVELADGITPETVESQFANYLLSKDKDFAESREYFLQPVSDIHLHSKLSNEISLNGDITYVSILSAVGFIILLMACFNYMNLTIARSTKRSREVGIRKVIGAHRLQLVQQFLGESVFSSIIALACALLMAELSMPLLNELSGKQLQLSLFGNTPLMTVLIFLAVFVGALAGSYPAVVLSAFKTVSVLKGRFVKVGTGSISLRKGLLVVQFTMSIVLLLSTLVIFNQLSFMRNKKLGINPEQVVLVPFQSGEIAHNYEQLRTRLLSSTGVLNVTAASNSFTSRVGGWRPYRIQGDPEETLLPTVVIAHDYFKTLEAEIVAGRDFDREFPSDLMHAYIINEAAAELLGLEKPVGTPVNGAIFTGSEWSRKDAKIIGVVKDFHMASLHLPIQPTIFSLYSEKTMGLQGMAIRISSNALRETISYIESAWRDFAPERPLEFSFMNEDVNALYQAEERFMEIFLAFVVLAIIVTCLGLFGLSGYSAAQRTKEIGIRKTLGASSGNIIRILSMEFLKLVLVSNIIAWPVGWYIMNGWLQDFAYRININAGLFLLSGTIALLIAFLTVSFQAVRASMTNPVKSLRYE